MKRFTLLLLLVLVSTSLQAQPFRRFFRPSAFRPTALHAGVLGGFATLSGVVAYKWHNRPKCTPVDFDAARVETPLPVDERIPPFGPERRLDLMSRAATLMTENRDSDGFLAVMGAWYEQGKLKWTVLGESTLFYWQLRDLYFDFLHAEAMDWQVENGRGQTLRDVAAENEDANMVALIDALQAKCDCEATPEEHHEHHAALAWLCRHSSI